MGKKIPQVDAYIEKAPDFAQPILTRIRNAFHQGCPQVEEVMKWGVPHFQYKGLLGGMAAFKQHVGLGFWKSRLMRDPAGLFRGDPKASMCSAKITNVRELPAKDVLLAYVAQARELNEKDVKEPRPTRPARAPIAPPPEFMAALKKNVKAKTAFAALSPSHQREYLEWITEAKQDATRTRRIATTIEWLTEGKSRNWKYGGKK